MLLCNVHLRCSIAPGAETTAVMPAVSISVIGLIIDASIPAGAGRAARNTAVAVRRGGAMSERGREKWKIEMAEQEKAP